MQRKMRHVLYAAVVVTIFWLSLIASTAAELVVSDTIQEAVDTASPGDTIVVPPGVYHEAVMVDKDNLTIRGSHAAILDASGFHDGIRVGAPPTDTGEQQVPMCPPIAVRNFTLHGLTIRNAEENGVFLSGVDGFHLTRSRYLNNGEYGPFPVCSLNGLIDFNVASGHNDAAIYVGDDDNVVVQHNRVSRSAIGIEIENTSNTVVRRNLLYGNTAGILVVVLPGLPMPFTQDVRIEHNLVLRNNFPNPIPTDSGEPLGLLPTGTGILNIGGDDVVIHKNVVLGNDSLGVAIVKNPFAPLDLRIEPNPDDNAVSGNVILGNGRHPDPERDTTPGADIVYDGSGSGNCFARNVFRTEFPDEITGLFPCP